MAVEINPANATVPGHTYEFSLGYTFTVDSETTVTELGKFDVDGDGMAADASACLFNWDTGEKLAGTVISASSTGEATGGINTHFAAIDPVILRAGTTYMAAVEVGAHEFMYGSGIAAWDENINWIEGRATGLENPAMPDTADAATFEIARDIDDCYFGPNFKFDADGIQQPDLSLSQPKTRAVFQRNDHDIAMVPVQGTYADPLTLIEARAVVMDGFSGSPSDWQIIDESPIGGSFSGTLSVAAGGWYSIEIRTFDGETPGPTAAVDRVGVGEVFIISGQSNSANFGQPKMTPTHDTVSAWTGSSWRHAYDPQPIANGNNGSPWSRLGDILVARFDVPIGFVTTGIGATRVGQWVPGTPYYTRIRSAIEDMGENGMRAILWHQGESDSIAGTSASVYASRLNSIIAQTRVDAGWDVPWGVALASYHPYSTSAQEAEVRAGQESVITGDPLVFQGADTDDFHNLGWLADSVHFDGTGLLEHARWWEVSIIRTFFPCDFEPNGKVDLSDFGLLAENWLDSNCKSVSAFSYGCNDCDLNNDGKVDMLDLDACAYNWLD
ncbi:sialate O-acetylesterase [Anaerohalosphaera lusitana]|uniref:sialate O-acetylesterase n=1 Tax=Anaerohalosphaera lusitana TaxID=1936003 RepID=UPI001474265F|nr:sialate O-acetylesterase [Anaerohalosphaera lusitana]